MDSRKRSYAITRPSLEAVALWIAVALVIWLIGYATISGLGRNYDFRTFYCAGRLVRQSPSKLYDIRAQDAMQDLVLSPHGALPFYHPAYEALLFVPLSFLTYSSAYFAFLGLNLVALAVCYLIAPLGAAVEGGRAMLLLVFGPILMCLLFGQDSILFLLLICMAWQLLRLNEDPAAGAVLALAMFKLSIVPVIAVVLCVRRGWRFAAGFLTTALVLALLCLKITGVSEGVAFVRLLSGVALVRDAFPEFMPTLHGLLYVIVGRWLTPWVFSLSYVAISSGLLVAVSVLVKRVTDLSVVYSAAILCGVIVSPHLYGYDFTVLLLPILLLSNRGHVIITWCSFAAGMLLITAWPVRFTAWGVALPAALLLECAGASYLRRCRHLAVSPE